MFWSNASAYHGRMEQAPSRIVRLARFAAEVAAETLWPTRCALCDMPGAVLCDACAQSLPVVDWWRACRRCGAPYGLRQCVTCNPVTLGTLLRDELPFAGCASATIFDDATGRIVRTFKDQGEQRLARVMAVMMARTVPPTWHFDAVSFVPATLAAVRHRGYDHAQLLGCDVGDELAVPCVDSLARPTTRDQRALTAEQRVENLVGRFQALDRPQPRRLLLVDDVFTTGATLCGATDALLAAGVEEVFCLTFARV